MIYSKQVYAKAECIMIRLYEIFPFLEEWVAYGGGWPVLGWLLLFCVAYAAIGTWWAFAMMGKEKEG
jgi:hypothetical protein